MSLDDVAELTQEDIEALVGEIRCKPIALGNEDKNWAGPQFERRYYAAVPFVAGEEFALFWPDQIAGIKPIDAEDLTASEQWMVGRVTNSPTGLGLITWIDLSEDEERREVEEQPTLPRRFAERIATARMYVNALAAQMERFFDEELVGLGLRIVSQRQRSRAIVANLRIPAAWKIPEPKVITDPTDQLGQPTDRAADSADQPATLPVDESITTQHVVPHRQRLDPASFEDVQRVTRIWADGVERYPAAFSVLIEDRVSDLLAATFNATLPGAHREVYRRSGKSDIYIEADVLQAGSGPAKIFICESKWARDKDWVMGSVDQLYRYLTTHDTSAMLLLLFRQQDFQAATSNAHAWLRSVDGYVDEEPSAVNGWPIFLYLRGPYELRLCLASVHLPPNDPAQDTPEAEPEG
jgi:hypothetical protein